MKRIKRLLIVIAFFVAGTLAGATAVSIQWHKVMSRFAATALTEIALDARQIHGGKADATLDRKTQAIPYLVQQLHSLHRRYLTESEYNGALWSVSRFYEDAEGVVPSSIQRIMESIPPRPKTSCELRGARETPSEERLDAEQTNPPDEK